MTSPPPAPGHLPAGTSARLAERLADPDARIVVLTGAGISAGAGIPTYRGAGGLYPAGTLIPLHARDAAARTVHTVWDRLRDIATVTAAAAPTAAHTALTAAQAAGRHVTVLTQNVDGLHTRAGTTGVLELHGTLARARCLNPKCAHTWELPTWPDPSGFDPAGSSPADRVPRCPVDGARARPHVTLFDERLDPGVLAAARHAAHHCDVVLAVGTSLQVHPAAGYVISALATGAVGAWLETDPDLMLAHVDPADRPAFTQLDQVPGDCQSTLPALLAHRRD